MLPSAARSQIVDGKKQCGLCREWFPIENFWKRRNASTGLFSACIPCATVRRNESYAKKPVPIEKSREYRARYRAKHPEKFKESHERQKLRKRGVTPEWFEAQLEAQGGGCKICGRPEDSVDNFSGNPRRLSVDHCHDTGMVRGLLCSRCNTALGLMADEPGRLREAALYLERSRSL